MYAPIIFSLEWLIIFLLIINYCYISPSSIKSEAVPIINALEKRNYNLIIYWTPIINMIIPVETWNWRQNMVQRYSFGLFSLFFLFLYQWLWYGMWQWHNENVYYLWDKVKPIGLYPRMDLLWVFIAILFLSIKYLLNSTRFIVFKIELYNWSLELGRY